MVRNGLSITVAFALSSDAERSLPLDVGKKGFIWSGLGSGKAVLGGVLEKSITYQPA